MNPEYSRQSFSNLKELLDQKVLQYNTPGFIADDPVSVPHLFTGRQDIEIAGFLAATIAWGNRKSILANALRLVALMDNSPFEFLVNARPKDFRPFLRFVHRTFNGDDCLFFLTSLQHIYRNYNSLEPLFSSMNVHGAAHGITRFRELFLETEHLHRSEKHIPNPMTGSAAKRLNMYLRWMVRRDDHGVDFGIWNSIDPANLVCPLDVHVGKTARKLGLLQRTSNDWKAVEELTASLRQFDPSDPVKYDFALFGMGSMAKYYQWIAFLTTNHRFSGSKLKMVFDLFMNRSKAGDSFDSGLIVYHRFIQEFPGGQNIGQVEIIRRGQMPAEMGQLVTLQCFPDEEPQEHLS